MPYSHSSLLPLQQSYPSYVYVLVPLLLLYFGIYTMLRNHYIFKPKVQLFLKKFHIKSVVLQQLIIDFCSNISILTFIISSTLITYSDKCIQLILHHDLYWIGLCMAILAYRNVVNKDDQLLDIKIVIKNAIFLIFAYIIIIYQYFSSYSMLVMEITLMLIYIVNLIINANGQQFVEFIDKLFSNKQPIIQIQPYTHINMVQSPQFLSQNFPVSKVQIQQKLKTYQPSLKQIKLKTKTAVTKKLLMISLAIKLSQQKMKQRMKKQVHTYYGGLNGTTNQKIKRIQFQIKYSVGQQNQINKDFTSMNQQDNRLMNLTQSDDQLDVLFTIFPVKLFQSSRIISILFSIFLNLTFGISLDYCMNITYTMEYGKYFNNLYAFLILPILPNISKMEYFNFMTLTSLWKYFLLGFFMIIYNMSSTDNIIFSISNIMHFQAIETIIMIVFVIGYLIVQSKSQYKIAVLFVLLFCGNIALTYYGVSQKS